MAASAVALALLLSGSRVGSQEAPATANTRLETAAAEPAKVLHFNKPPHAITPSPLPAPSEKTTVAQSNIVPIPPALPLLVKQDKTELLVQALPKPAVAPLAQAGGLFAEGLPKTGQDSQADVPLRLAPLAIPPREPSAPPAVKAKPSVATPARGVQAAVFQPPAGLRPLGEEGTEYQVQLEPPGPQRLFRLEAETRLQERMRQEARERPTPERIAFPEEPIATGGWVVRQFPPANMRVEPHFVCYQRLYFTELNSERYGWDLGPVQPFVSGASFFWDVLLLPYHLGIDPCRCYECSAGYCLPGDPVPYLCYPPTFSLTGLTFEAATAVVLFAAFP
jgi:hypothetical protein